MDLWPSEHKDKIDKTRSIWHTFKSVSGFPFQGYINIVSHTSKLNEKISYK